VGKHLPVVPSRESNSGLPYSKPTRYQLSHAAPMSQNSISPKVLIRIPKTGDYRDTILVCRDGRLEVTAVLAALAYPELASAAPRHGGISPFFPVLQIREISVRIRNRGSIPLTNGSDSCYFYHINKNLFFPYVFHMTFEGTFTSFFKDKKS
jgi:hypothetical protein